MKTERKTNHKRLLNIENKLRVAGGVLGGGMGYLGDEHLRWALVGMNVQYYM